MNLLSAGAGQYRAIRSRYARSFIAEYNAVINTRKNEDLTPVRKTRVYSICFFILFGTVCQKDKVCVFCKSFLKIYL